jgi:hypothetical protein
MDKKKLIILILVVVGVLTLMMFGAGAYRSKNDRRPKDDAEPHPLAKLIGGATGWLKPEFKISRMGNVCRSGEMLTISSTCEIKIAPGGTRPSSFKLQPVSGDVSICFAFSQENLRKCVLKLGEPKLRSMEGKEAGFTVAKDAAFLFLSCSPPPGSSSSCALRIKKD